MDSALDDFLARFGDPDPNKKMVQNQKRTPASSVKEGTGFNASGLTSLVSGGLEDTKLPSQLNLGDDSQEEDTTGDKVGKAASTALEAAPHALALLSNAKGGQFDTSADGDGPGKAGGAILQGAAQGAQLGKIAGPWGMAIGAAVGGLTSTFAHTGAMRKWRSNQVKKNLSENALEKAKNEEEYAREEGLASLSNLKSLREKQLGIIS